MRRGSGPRTCPISSPQGSAPSGDKAQIFDLAPCQPIARHEHVLIYGPTGVGKSHVGQALAHEACRRGFDRFTDAAKLLAHLAGGPRTPPSRGWPATPAPTCSSSMTSGSSP